MRRSPLAYVVVPLVFTAISAVIFSPQLKSCLPPIKPLSVGSSRPRRLQPQDLLANAATVINGGAAEEASSQPDSIPLSSVTYPTVGDRYATITVSGTNVDAPVFYGDTNKILNQGVGTYANNGGAGIPGEGKTILLAGHNNTFFNDLQHAEVGATVTITTHYGRLHLRGHRDEGHGLSGRDLL